jgi:hypothetical protein
MRTAITPPCPLASTSVAAKPAAVVVGAAPSIPSPPEDVIAEDDGDSNAHTASTSSYDEDDIGDEDGDIEGGVSFKGDLLASHLANAVANNNNNAAAAAGAGALVQPAVGAVAVGDAIPEEDEEEEEEDEDSHGMTGGGSNDDDDDDDIYGLMDYSSNNAKYGGVSAPISLVSANNRGPSDFKGIDLHGPSISNTNSAAVSASVGSSGSTLSIGSNGSDAPAALNGGGIATTSTSTSASNPGAPSGLPIAVGSSLSERVDAYRRLCIQGLGEAVFESTYEAVKEALFGGSMDDEGDRSGGEMGGDDEGGVDAKLEKIAMTMLGGASATNKNNEDKRVYLPYVEALVHMEEQLL